MKIESRVLKYTLVSTLAFYLLAPQSKADDASTEIYLQAGVAIFGSIPIGVASTAFFIRSTYDAVQGRWLPEREAKIELYGGAIPNLLLGLFWSTREGFDINSTLAITHLALGSAFLAHSLLSLHFYKPSHNTEDDAQEGISSVSLGVMPTQGGALGSLAFRF